MRLLCVCTCLPLFAAIVESEVGLTGRQSKISCLYASGSLDPQSPKLRLLLLGGLDGSASEIRAQVDRFESSRYRNKFTLAAIPLANPESAKLQFPPPGNAYAEHTESHYLWRWIGSYAPDLLLILGPDSAGLGNALSQHDAAGVGRIPSRTIMNLESALSDLEKTPIARSPAHDEILKRLRRSPIEIAKQLSVPYGHELPEAVYIPAVAALGRLRLGELADVERIVAPYVSGQKNSLAKPSGSHQSGHLLFAELARKTSNKRYVELVQAAADMGFDEKGQMRESMPLHNEMSDSFFMGCPILAEAGRLTGQTKYYDMALRHMRFMLKLDLRPDGLYRHSPLDEAAWGRGNGFGALGVALTLTALPKSHSGFPEMLDAFRKHIEALARHQEPTGMWRQVIDHPGSYRELSATCMIGVSILRGIRNGWLPKAKYQPIVDRAWNGAKSRIAADGRLIDVCTGTGKQKSLKDYLDRQAILGNDPRGGAMSLLFSTEMAGLQ